MPAAIGAAIAVVVAFAGTQIGAIVVNLAIAVGLSLISGALSRKSSPLPTPSDGQTEIRQPLSPRVRSYGKVRASGTVWWLDAIADTLYLGLALNHGRISEYLTFHIDENVVDIDGTDKVTTSPYSANGVYLHSRLGAATETKYDDILTGFGVDEVRGDGVASILAIVQHPATAVAYQNAYPNGRPTIRATVKASVVWDPRDSTQVRTTETTWAWSENPVVCLLNYLLSADGYGIPWERISPNLQQWKDAADVCEEEVDLAAGGTASRYILAGTYRLTDDPSDVVAKFCSTCDGRVWTRRDGSIGVAVGKFVPPSVTIANDQILGYSDLVRGQDPVRAIEGIRAQYMSPDHDYREHEAEPWPTGAEVLELSEDRTIALDLLWVPSSPQARRLMKRAYLRAHADWRGTILTNLAGLKAVDERYIRVKIDELAIDDTFEVGRFTLDPNGLTCEIEILAVDAAIDEWDATTEEGTADSGTFDFPTIYAKTGTTIDVLSEALGVTGQTAYVFAANAVGVPVTPAGWTLVPGMTASVGGLAMVVYRKVLDGTEVSITVASGTAAIIVALMYQMPVPVESDLNIEVQTGIPARQTKDVITAPYAVFQFGAANSDFDDPSVWFMEDSSKVAIAGARDTVQRTGAVTAQLNVMVYPSASTPVTILAGMTSDHGQNGMLSFIAVPGT